MKFVPFQSLRLVKPDTLQRAIDHGYDQTPYFITEKVDGSNFSFYCDGANIKTATRNGFIEGKSFKDSKRVTEKYSVDILMLSRMMLNQGFYQHAENGYVITTGELYGGSVRRKTPYKEEQDFVMFDLCVVHPATLNNLEIFDKEILETFKNIHYDEENELILFYPSYKKLFMDWVKDCFTIPVAPILFSGTLAECLQYDQEFKSNYTDNGKIEKSGLKGDHLENLMTTEGIVIEPCNPVIIGGARAIYKKKTSKYDERKKGVVEKSFRELQVDKLLPNEAEACYHLEELINRNRFDSVISKYNHDLKMKDFPSICKDFLDDVFKDFDEMLEEDNVLIASVEVNRHTQFKNLKVIKALLYKEVENLVKPLLKETLGINK